MAGTAEFTAVSGGGTIDLSSADGASNGYTLIGGNGVDELTGDGGNDTFKINRPKFSKNFPTYNNVFFIPPQ